MNDIYSKIVSKSPLLARRYSSEQYLLSKKILTLKHEKGLDSKEMSNELNMNLETYLEFEGGYVNHSTKDYYQLIAKMKDLKNKTN